MPGSSRNAAPQVKARARGSFVVDSVCPLVTKVHHEVKVRAGKGYRIVYVGHEGHEEAVGTMAVAPQSIHRVESVDEVALLPAEARAREALEVRRQYPDIVPISYVWPDWMLARALMAQDRTEEAEEVLGRQMAFAKQNIGGGSPYQPEWLARLRQYEQACRLTSGGGD